jgi:hypothetical protein
MELSIQMSEWLENNMNKKILIRKQEQEDLDEVLIHLKLVEFRDERKDGIDDYVSDSALLLHGHGSVITNGEQVELPSNTFEIPLSGFKQAAVDKDSLNFETERAQYSLILQ